MQGRAGAQVTVRPNWHWAAAGKPLTSYGLGSVGARATAEPWGPAMEEPECEGQRGHQGVLDRVLPGRKGGELDEARGRGWR